MATLKTNAANKLGLAIDALLAQILAYEDLKNWAKNHFHRDINIIYGNRLTSEIKPQLLPALVVEIGNGSLDAQDVGGGSSEYWRYELIMSLVWAESDPTKALQQRVELTSILPGAVHQDQSVSNTLDSATLIRVETDRGVNHPTQLLSCEIEIFYQT